MKLEFPDWAAFTPDVVAHELPLLLEEAEKAVSTLEASCPTDYEDFVWALDDATRDLWRCWGGVSHMLSVMNADAWRRLEEAWQPKVVAFSLRVGQSKRLYEIARNCLGALSPAAPDAPVRRRILERMVQSAELAGVGLGDAARARFNEIEVRLAKLAADFHNAVIDATAAFSFEKDGKTYTIDDANYPETMKHCADRQVRETLYRARVSRAPDNAPRIDEILRLRREKAAILGFETAADVSLATKCAPSVAAVLEMIDALDAATVGKAALERLPGEPWDLAYEAERLRERQYAYSEDELKRFFELEDVLKGLFRITRLLFGVEVEEAAARPSVWREDVRFFAVKENGEAVAHFYFDPYVRAGQKSGGAWMNEFRNRSVRGGPRARSVLPLALVCTNLPEKDADGRCLLPFREVETLFHEFGHALQCMLTRVDEEDAAGISLVEWDAVEVASQFLENWCLDDRTGIVVPADLKAKVRAAKNFRAATACRRQLAFAKTDLILHGAVSGGCGGRTPDEIKAAVFAHFGLPVIPEDRFLCSFTHIFAGGYAAGYYGYKWAEVMSADCYGAFEEAGLDDDEAVRTLGRRYRETVLGLGGSRSARDVFRAFRGRGPEIAALIRQQELEG